MLQTNQFSLTSIGNETCRYQSIDMSPGFDYYIQNCRGPSIPASILRNSSDHSIIGVLESNQGNSIKYNTSNILH